MIVYGAGAQRALASAGATDVLGLPLIGAVAGSIPAPELGELALAHGVAYVAADSPMRQSGSVGAAWGDPYGALVTLFPRTSGATTAWSKGLTGQSVGVAVIDSGVAPAPTDLGSRLVQVELSSQGTGKVNDVVGHGTFVSEVVAGAADGRHIGVLLGAAALRAVGDAAA